MNSKLRCRGCDEYKLRTEFTYERHRCCSQPCFDKWRLTRSGPRTRPGPPGQPPYPQFRNARPKKQRPKLLPGVRSEVRRRDGDRCRWCGKRDVHLHHILYRSQGGPDVAWNLISLCEKHHNGGSRDSAHGDKKRWQPVLLAIIWEEYVNGRALSVPQMEKHLVREGMIPGPTRLSGRRRS